MCMYIYIYDIDKHIHTIIYCHTYTLHQTRHQLFIHFTMRYHGEPKYNLDTLDCVTWDKSTWCSFMRRSFFSRVT